MRLTKQFVRELAPALTASLLMFANGVALGWSSPAIPSLQRDEVFRDMVTKEAASWIGRVEMMMIMSKMRCPRI